MPTGNKITFIDSIYPIKNAQGSPRWTSTVELSETPRYEPTIKSFPADGRCSPFVKKKDARQCMLSLLE